MICLTTCIDIHLSVLRCANSLCHSISMHQKVESILALKITADAKKTWMSALYSLRRHRSEQYQKVMTNVTSTSIFPFV